MWRQHHHTHTALGPRKLLASRACYPLNQNAEVDDDKPVPGICRSNEVKHVKQDRRNTPRGDVDRRRSSRWAMNRSIQWRVQGRRQSCSGLLKERSLDGLLIFAPHNEQVSVGSRLVIAKHLRERLGCRSAVVRRIENATAKSCELVAEIEA